MKAQYDPSEIEKIAQTYWEMQHSFEVKEDLSRKKFYCLSMLPYPSGALHMGHVRNYTIGDMLARYMGFKSHIVLQPIGFDSFGLPAENAAIKHNVPPYEWTEKNIKKMRKQFKTLGYAFDWRREISTCDPEYYRWEQWLFVKLYQKGLVYKKNAIVNWDPVDQTVLANEQVVDGKGWRSGAVVERREIPQWFFKITAYADELLAGLDQLDGWPEQVKTMQRNWIGRSEGANIKFKVSKQKCTIQVYTTRPDTLMGCTYLAIAPEHPVALEAAKDNKDVAKFVKQCRHRKVAEADIATQEKLGVDTGFQAIHPITKKKLPIWITNFVLMEYGEGAVMSVPAHDQRDFEFAQKYNLPIVQVIAPPKKVNWDFTEAAWTEGGTLIQSAAFDGLTSEKAKVAITAFLTEKKCGERTINYRLRDWGISRQRYWGTPIPIIYCKQCGEVPVPEADLPVTLPTDLIPDGHGSPLAKCPEFYKVKCPICKKAAKRDVDTMDTFVESSWYYARYCCNDQDGAMLDDRAKFWTPVDQYIGGVEHAVMHLLYARFMHKVLRDEGLLNSDEPFKNLLTQGMVLKDGHKMSKSKGNVVSPNTLIKKYGADTVRLFVMFASPPEQSLEWSDSGVEGAHRFLKKVWQLACKHHEMLVERNQQTPECPCDFKRNDIQADFRTLHQILMQATTDMDRMQYNTVVSAAMKCVNLLQTREGTDDDEQQFLQEGISILLRLLSPIAPHITHQLWRDLGYGKDILDADWPKVNLKVMRCQDVEMVIQVNGKLRSKITLPSNSEEKEVQTRALADKNIQRHVEGKPIKKVVVVPNKLVNIVV